MAQEGRGIRKGGEGLVELDKVKKELFTICCFVWPYLTDTAG